MLEVLYGDRPRFGLGAVADGDAERAPGTVATAPSPATSSTEGEVAKVKLRSQRRADVRASKSHSGNGSGLAAALTTNGKINARNDRAKEFGSKKLDYR